MNLKKAEQYQRTHRKIPVGTVLASPEPLEINLVFMLSGYRFCVAREISREEFQKRHMENLQADAAYGNIDVKDSKATIDPVEARFPSENQKYFYEAKLIR